MTRLDNDLQPVTINPLAPAQTAIRYCLANFPAFQRWAAVTFGAHYEPGFFDDSDALRDDLTECHNAIGRLIDEAASCA